MVKNIISRILDVAEILITLPALFWYILVYLYFLLFKRRTLFKILDEKYPDATDQELYGIIMEICREYVKPVYKSRWAISFVMWVFMIVVYFIWRYPNLYI